MGGKLVIVESPAKAKTITKFLGRGYVVRASLGHVRDLPKSKFGVDIPGGFKPEYIAIRGKGKVIKELREAAEAAERVLLATDPDREGEAISWHLGELLGLNLQDECRIEFHEITARAISAAVKNPRRINLNLVDAQQTRRILDRIVGYQLSPLLWRKVRRGLSAGRVQSVAVRLICEREREIQAFQPEEYWTVAAHLATAGGAAFTARLVLVDGKKAALPDRAAAEDIRRRVEGEPFVVAEVRRKERSRHPAAPFTTSSLQQEASRKLGFSARKTMQLAQQLYEGLEVPGEGLVGLITYIRTDSVRVAEEAKAQAREYIMASFGANFVPEKPPFYKTRAGAQGAHEAIRPTAVERTPERMKAALNRDQLRLYELIWRRFVASQMASAVLDTVSVDILADGCTFRATGSTVKFPGFMQVYTEGRDAVPAAGRAGEGGEEEEEEVQLPTLAAGDRLTLQELSSDQHFTEPPPRFSEAMLVKTMEELGIGRPSTYAPTIETILEREYVTLQDRRFVPTNLGFIVVDLLKQHFPNVVDVGFTAELEDQLDAVEAGKLAGLQVLQAFYPGFAEQLEKAQAALERVKLPDEETDEVCEVCGRKMVIKHGRFGRFLACPGYPECKNTRPLRKEIGVPCPKCGSPLVERKSKKGRTFFGCSAYPACDFVSWNEPVNEKCPACGHLLVKRRRGRNVVVACVNPECERAEGKGVTRANGGRKTDSGRRRSGGK
ncbi:MAG TPA: type I DNA topoisomerase [Firmicutes bacterium]|nr:type I DNA topoisomerase [Bacillota bacterium]